MFSFIKNIFNRTIHKACENGNIKAIKRFLADGTDVHVKNDDGYTPLWIAAGWGHKEIAELLIAEGADVNAMSDGLTTLHWAVELQEKGTAELLIEKGADVNVQCDGISPLHSSVWRGDKEITELLISKGANVNSLNEDKGTPLDLLSSKELEGVTAEIAILLRKHGGKTADELRAAGN